MSTPRFPVDESMDTRSIVEQATEFMCADDNSICLRVGLNGPECSLSWKVACDFFEADVLKTAKRHPGWLPIENKFQKLQVHRIEEDGAPDSFQYTGLETGGAGIVLSEGWVKTFFEPGFITFCKEAEGTPMPIPPGTSSESASDKGGGSSVVPAGAIDVPENPYQQGDKDYCVPYGTADALSFAGDLESAAYIAAIAPQSRKEPESLKFVQEQCYKYLQPSWTTVKLKNAHAMDPLQLDQTRVTVIQIEDVRKFTGHAIATFGGYIFDSNKTHPMSLAKEGLDACCFKGDGFGKVVKGFQLIPQSTAKVETGKRSVAPEKPRHKMPRCQSSVQAAAEAATTTSATDAMLDAATAK